MLSEIIDKSYRLFAKYNPTRPLDVCTDCCMTPENEAKLASLPVSQIPKDLLMEYNDSAKPEKTRVEEVKHFLPRYFELAGQFDFPTHSTELTFSRLIPFDQTEWTQEELGLLKQFSKEYFKHCISIYPIPSFSDSIDTVLVMLWRAGFGIEDLLTIWENENTKESALHFRDLYFHGFDQYNQSKLRSPFGDKELTGILRNWLDAEKQIFRDNIERLILESSSLAGDDINDLNLLYEIMQAKKSGL